MKSRFRPAATLRRIVPAALTALLLLGAVDARAQTPQEVQEQLRALGLQNMTPEQIRERLSQMGHDSSLLDPYMTSGTRVQPDQLPPAARSAVEALRVSSPPVDRADLPRVTLPDSSAVEKDAGLRVFGLRTFARQSTQFDPLSSGPIPPGYTLAPGDEVVLIMTGDVEEQHVMPVTREGFIVIPRAGQVWVNGLTMAELRDRLYTVLGRVYSGVGRGPEATIHFEASLGRLRSNQVFLSGEIVNPGSYATTGMASVLNALYLAKGPLPTGSFRDVRVLRNGELVERVDLYDYLTRGNNMANLGLNSGDVVFVPPVGPQVAVRGAVGREALYEIRDSETLLDVIEFAGGLTAPAAMGRARITRILPPSQRTEPGIDRTVVDVDLAAVALGEAPPPQLYDGDQLHIFRVRPEIRQVITVTGAVWKDCRIEDPARQERERQERQRLERERLERQRLEQERLDEEREEQEDDEEDPAERDARQQLERVGNGADTLQENETARAEATCTFHYRPGMRAWDAIAAAEGLRAEAYRERAQIVRVNPSDSTLSVVPFSLETAPDGTPLENPALEEFDAIRVFSRTEFQDSLVVRISGQVRRPGRGTFRYHEGMTLQDLLLEAGGLTPEADLTIEVSRRPGPEERRRGRLTETVRVPVDESYIISEEGIRFYPGDRTGDDGVGPVDGGPSASDLLLRPHDHVFVRRVPNLSEGDRTVRIAGELTYPGEYALQSKDERLSHLVERAGGLTGTAFAGGFRLYRNDELVNVDLPSVLENPGTEDDLVLLPGDSMVVPLYDPVVVVQGAVNSPAAVLYQEGAGLDYYIGNAGGYARNADRSHVHVRFANGEGAVPQEVLFYTRAPRPGPGSVVNVPEIPESEQRDLLDTIRDVAQVAGPLATLLVVLSRL